MTINEAILKSLEDIEKPASYMEIYNNIVDKKYPISKDGKTPESTISALLGNFIRNGDNRVKRIKQLGGTYSYYLTKNEDSLNLNDGLENEQSNNAKKDKKTFSERDLHILLSTYLYSINISSKTIFHEQSNGKDNNQI